MNTLKELADWGAFGTLAGVAMQVLEPVSAVVGLVWLGIRIWETETVKEWRGKKDGHE